MKTRKKRIIASIIVICLLVGILALTDYLSKVSEYQKNVKSLTLDEINLSSIPDGDYIGECDVNFICAKVQVTVDNGKITDIVILQHKNERGQSAEMIVDRIVKEQKIDVDAISGATNSSIVLKKAVENALTL